MVQVPGVPRPGTITDYEPETGDCDETSGKSKLLDKFCLHAEVTRERLLR